MYRFFRMLMKSPFVLVFAPAADVRCMEPRAAGDLIHFINPLGVFHEARSLHSRRVSVRRLPRGRTGGNEQTGENAENELHGTLLAG